MYEMTVEVPDELALELRPYREDLVALLQLGLEERRKNEQMQNIMSVKQVLQQLADEGKLIPPKLTKNRKVRGQRSLVRVTGQPVSKIVIEQRGAK